MNHKTDFLIIGAGIIGLTLASALRKKYANKRIVILEKEQELAYHASGRNSGVLHAGFYYSQDSLKAKFTLEGNRAWKQFCLERQLPLNQNGKVVVTKNAAECDTLQTLYQRGCANNIPLQLLSVKELQEIEPNAKTYEQALYSPETATVSPTSIVQALVAELTAQQVEVYTDEAFVKVTANGAVHTSKNNSWVAAKVINCAGLYADKIAKEYGLAQNYTIMPFKGLYLKYAGTMPPVKVNVYPVPDLSFPFLGVHFTVTVDNEVKLGPTAMPAFWRENYSGLSRFNFNELKTIVTQQMSLFVSNRFNFRAHALQEIKKSYKPYFINQAKQLVKALDINGFKLWGKPGIRAQLLDLQTGLLVNDFVVEANEHTVHVLNAVSPAFTCALPFANWLVEQYL